MFLVLKLARDFLSLQKDLHTFQKDKEGTYDYKFSTVCVLRKGLGWWEESLPLFLPGKIKPLIFNFYLTLHQPSITAPDPENSESIYEKKTQIEILWDSVIPETIHIFKITYLMF